jgi:hypothetical protein
VMAGHRSPVLESLEYVFFPKCVFSILTVTGLDGSWSSPRKCSAYLW